MEGQLWLIGFRLKRSINPGPFLPGDYNYMETKRHKIISHRARSQFSCLLPMVSRCGRRKPTYGCCAPEGKCAYAYGMIGWRKTG